MVGGLEPPPEAEEARAEAAQRQGVVFVLEGASLETGKVGKVCSQNVYESLCCIVQARLNNSMCLSHLLSSRCW